jgi:hypothetical protein
VSAAIAPTRRTKLALRLRQAELRLRAASMRCYAARLQIDAEAVEALLDSDPGIAPTLDLEQAKKDVVEQALETERLRRELGL